MAKFDLAYKITMKYEGGYANNVHDTGGETWRGVARKHNPTWPGWKIVDAVKASHPANLNQALAARADLETLVLALYRQQYWNSLSLDQLSCQQLANQLFDISVNSGPGTAARFLQRALNVHGNPQVAVDGDVGSETLKAVGQQPCQQVYEEVNKLRTAFYQQIVANNPSQAVFLKGWLKRILPYQPTAAPSVA